MCQHIINKRQIIKKTSTRKINESNKEWTQNSVKLDQDRFFWTESKDGWLRTEPYIYANYKSTRIEETGFDFPVVDWLTFCWREVPSQSEVELFSLVCV